MRADLRSQPWRYWLWILFIIDSPLIGQDPLVLGKETAYTSLMPYTAQRADPSGALTIDDIRHSTMQPAGDSIDLGFKAHPYWFRFSLENPEETTRKLHLVISFSQLDDIKIFGPSSKTPIQMGDHYPYEDRPIRLRTFTLPIEVPQGRHEWHLRVSTTSSFSLPMAVMTPEHHLAHVFKEQLFFGLYYGLFLSLSLYNLLLFVGTRERSYGFLAFFGLLTMGYSSVHDGLDFLIWPTALVWHNHAIITLASLAFFFALQFGSAYLQLPKNNRILSAIVSILSGLFLLLAVGTFFMPVLQGARLLSFAVLTSLIALLSMGVRRVVQHYHMANYFLLAWSTFFLICGMTALAAMGVIGGFSFFALYGLKIANGSVLLLLSLGQGHRIQELKVAHTRDQEDLARAKAESEAKTMFLARMSHELRTPINAVLGVTDLLSDSQLDQEQRNHLAMVETAGKSLLAVINDVLDFARLETESLTMEYTPFRLDDLLEDCYSIFALGAAKPGVTLAHKLVPDTPVQLLGDVARVRQVVLNLLANASKFTEQGSIVLSADHIGEKSDHHLFRITVEDTGIGIEPNAKKQLFDPFTQADITTSRRYGGSGLGLSICKALVNMMDGDIDVESEPGKGSRFWFTFKARLNPNPIGNQTANMPSKDALPNLGHLNVLVAEDNRINRMVILGFLKRFDIFPKVAENGQEAIALYLASEPAPDLILMDCEMPEMDGYQASRHIRELEASSQNHALIVALTAHTLPEHRAQCRAAGMDEHLSKPLTFRELTQFLRDHFPEGAETHN